MKKGSFSTAALLAPVLMALMLHACGSAVRATIDDGTVTTRVKTALINDPVVAGLRIDVSTFKGVVTLSGRVTSRDQESRAITLARSIKGVTDVKSTLQVQSQKTFDNR